MNGWQRLWIFLSAVWGVLIIVVAVFMIHDTYSPPYIPFDIVDKIPEQYHSFYNHLEKNEKGPAFDVPLVYTSGTSVVVRFPALSEEHIRGDFKGRLQRQAEREGKEISDYEINSFLKQVSEANEIAKEAKLAYEFQSNFFWKERSSSRKDVIMYSALIWLLPSAIIFLLGYGISWVKRGFSKK